MVAVLLFSWSASALCIRVDRDKLRSPVTVIPYHSVMSLARSPITDPMVEMPRGMAP